jgi:hypothetical protein
MILTAAAGNRVAGPDSGSRRSAELQRRFPHPAAPRRGATARLLPRPRTGAAIRREIRDILGAFRPFDFVLAQFGEFPASGKTAPVLHKREACAFGGAG